MAKSSYIVKSRKAGEIITQYPLYLPAALMAAIKQAAQARRCTAAHVIRTAIALGLPQMGNDLPVAVNTNGKGDSDDGEQNQLRSIVR